LISIDPQFKLNLSFRGLKYQNKIEAKILLQIQIKLSKRAKIDELMSQKESLKRNVKL